ncbi:hypothetical protein ACLOJK_030728 [Asimina triloba]
MSYCRWSDGNAAGLHGFELPSVRRSGCSADLKLEWVGRCRIEIFLTAVNCRLKKMEMSADFCSHCLDGVEVVDDDRRWGDRDRTIIVVLLLGLDHPFARPPEGSSPAAMTAGLKEDDGAPKMVLRWCTEHGVPSM